MPFWDRKIDIVIVTHPQEDHFGGLVDVVRNYDIGIFLRPDVEGTADGWKVFKSELAKRLVEIKTVSTGSRIRTTNISFDILNPSILLRASPSSDLNDYSIVGKLSYGNFDALLTGDIMQNMISQFTSQITPVEVLKVPHHGSKNGLSQEMLDATSPKLAVISCGKNNRHGHPHQEVLEMLSTAGVKAMRTDLDGEIEVVSDGKNWWVRK